MKTMMTMTMAMSSWALARWRGMDKEFFGDDDNDDDDDDDDDYDDDYDHDYNEDDDDDDDDDEFLDTRPMTGYG